MNNDIQKKKKKASETARQKKIIAENVDEILNLKFAPKKLSKLRIITKK